MKALEKFCWVIVAGFGIAATFRLALLAISSGASAPQYAAEAAGTCAMVIVPYIFARAVQEFSSDRLKNS